jgi:hypothetical protein
MNETELLTEPELTPIVEAYLATKQAYEIALNKTGWSISLDTYFGAPRTETDFTERVETNTARLTERAEQIAQALEIGSHFADFLAIGIDLVANDYQIKLWAYNRQQQEIAEAPLREWRTAYNARLAEIDKQIKGAKIRQGKAYGLWRKNAISYAEANARANAIEIEINALITRREIVAAERFEQVA